MKLLLVITLAFAGIASAQISPNAADQYRVGAGVTYVFYHISLEMTSQQATLRPGAEYEVFHTGNWSGSMLGDAGLATGTGAILGSFSGGGKLSYNFGARLSKGASNYYAEFACRVLYTAGQPSTALPVTAVGVIPIFEVRFTRGF